MRKIAILLLCLLLLSTFTAFLPTGYAPDPSTFTLERPSADIDIQERVENAFTDGEASVGIGVAIDDYDENDGHYEGKDSVSLNVSMAANSRKGITYGCYMDSLFWIDENDLWYRIDYDNVGDNWGTWIDFPDADGWPFYVRFYGA